VRVTASVSAQRHIRKRGGSLYIWLRDPGWRSGWVTLRIRTEPPPADEHPDFKKKRLESVSVFVDRAIPGVEHLQIGTWPITGRLRVRGLPRTSSGGGDGGGGGGGGF
jgi:hypothetical protein